MASGFERRGCWEMTILAPRSFNSVEVVLTPGLGDRNAVDEPIDQHRVDLIERQLLRRRRQVLLGRLDIREAKLGPVYPRDDGVAAGWQGFASPAHPGRAGSRADRPPSQHKRRRS